MGGSPNQHITMNKIKTPLTVNSDLVLFSYERIQLSKRKNRWRTKCYRDQPRNIKKTEGYTDESPGGPWSRYLRDMGAKAERIEKYGCSGTSKEESKDDCEDEKKPE